jgi:hypothetical protein
MDQYFDSGDEDTPMLPAWIAIAGVIIIILTL